MRLTEFWGRMEEFFGPAYARSVARDHVMSTLAGRTVEQAVEDGDPLKRVWRAVCVDFDVPETLH